MNVTIYAESFDWLFAQREAEHPCLWSFGRHRPPVDIGDDLIFRRDGWPLARAIVRGIYQPGECDVDMHDGSRPLTGWKVLWYQGDFEDLRGAQLPKRFGSPLTPAMYEVLHSRECDGRIPDRLWVTQKRNVLDPLISRGLVRWRPDLDRLGVMPAYLTLEGWRVLLRWISEQRREDIAHVMGRGVSTKLRRANCRKLGIECATFAIGDIGTWCCRICGCTDSHGCDEGCSWHSINLCTSCARLIEQLSRQPAGASS